MVVAVSMPSTHSFVNVSKALQERIVKQVSYLSGGLISVMTEHNIKVIYNNCKTLKYNVLKNFNIIY